jgi:hypothetical protein
MKSIGAFAMTYLSVTQHETRHEMIDAERERAHRLAASGRIVDRPRRRRSPRRWFRAVRSTAAA